jgi:Ion channel
MSSPSPFHRWRSGEIGLSIVLGLQIAIMFVIAPLAATGLLPGTTVDLFRLGLAAVAVLLVTPNRLGAAVVGITFLVSLLLSFGFSTGVSGLVVALERLTAVTAFDLAIVAVVAHRVFSGGRVSVHRIMGAVILYLSIGLIFANIYRVCTLLLHPSFSTLTAGSGGALSQLLYFSLTTTGFGDIAPVHPFVRSLANLESVIGQLFPATLLARLVTLHARPERGREEDEA